MSLKNLTFKGGIHPPHYKKATEGVPIERAKAPETVVIPMQQHIGAPCEPVVKVGDKVKVGQKIGEPKAFVSAPIHSSVSGVVKKITSMNTPTGSKVTCVVIESDGNNEVHETVKPKGDLDSLSGKEIVEVVKEAGITGMGGAGFPTHVKLSPPSDKKIDTVILNGAECEPYLTADHRLMLEQPEKVVFGLKAIMKAVGVEKGYIGIENNKPDAVEAMEKVVANEPNIEVASLVTKYPQGDEKRLINAVTGREVPSGGLPMDVGVVVNNVGTAAAIADAIQTGMPLIERIVTITGSAIKEPKNLIVKIGTSFKEVIEQCEGYKGQLGKIVSGGPMMGIAQFTDEVPVIKGTSGILVLNEKEAKVPDPQPCIRCGKCVDICPVNLQPLFLSQFSLRKMYDEADKYHILDCIECGSCSFVCPSKRPLVEAIRVGKREVIAKRKKAQK
ncbi:electron transport complex subunit RsxC [Caldisalinibacter kiritimatiensis]|uniref:Ion-translocating oxidoreductase complex subunit C n=1 Tax=Caldisalinibacter kiritimatiensis TaxID=1304284 RepID=R1CT11_9FIRM|nr:electron transport complex subunit RsxC [Caldisalinibacter kiritimatiensis]EOC99838.1 Electron transport complex protein RnfC [Caldisalinibacter kiritimatiensis]